MAKRFTDQARKGMAVAETEARGLNHEYVGTEHILLGLVHEDTGVVTSALKTLGLDKSRIRLEVERLVQRGPETVSRSKLPYTPRAKRAIEYAEEEAWNL